MVLMGPSRPLFVYFHPLQYVDNFSMQFESKLKKRLGFELGDHSMKGADESNVLWLPPACIDVWPMQLSLD